MNWIFRVALIGSVATAAPARADLQIVPVLSGAARSVQPAPKPIVLSPPPAGLMRRPLPAIQIASGFGRQVPLAFAVRQIVPAGVRTTFGPEVDQAALVNWTGGGPWIEVLRTAVNPLGLHVAVRSMAIAITLG